MMKRLFHLERVLGSVAAGPVCVAIIADYIEEHDMVIVRKVLKCADDRLNVTKSDHRTVKEFSPYEGIKAAVEMTESFLSEVRENMVMCDENAVVHAV